MHMCVYIYIYIYTYIHIYTHYVYICDILRPHASCDAYPLPRSDSLDVLLMMFAFTCVVVFL